MIEITGSSFLIISPPVINFWVIITSWSENRQFFLAKIDDLQLFHFEPWDLAYQNLYGFAVLDA